ncbi:MAG: hypothetical protein ACLP00_29995 [Terracidiphilus sp.]
MAIGQPREGSVRSGDLKGRQPERTFEERSHDGIHDQGVFLRWLLCMREQCPNKAISESNFEFVIDPEECTECIGFFDVPQCVAACPIPKTCGVINPDVPRYQAA